MPLNPNVDASTNHWATGRWKCAQPFKTVEDYDNWLARVDDYLLWLYTAEDRMKEGVEKNVVLPKSLIKKVVPQLASIALTDLEDHLFYGPTDNFQQAFQTKIK